MQRRAQSPQRAPAQALSRVISRAVRRQTSAQSLQSAMQLRRRHAGKRLLLVTHGGVMRLLLARARGLAREQLLQVEVGHGALHRLRLAETGEWEEIRTCP